MSEYKQVLRCSLQMLMLQTNAEDFYNQGSSKAQKGDYIGAIKEFNQVLRINPIHANAWHKRGVVRYNLGDTLGAIKDYNQAIKIDPKLAKAYCNRGLALHGLKDTQRAIKDLQKAIELFLDQDDIASYKRSLDKIREWQRCSGKKIY